MKKKLYKNLSWIMLFAVVLAGCSTKMKFSNSAVVPGAKGTVTIKEDKNGNSHIDLEVVNLAKPELLTPPKNEYVVWMLSENTTRKLGGLNISKSNFSQAMKGSMETVTTEKPNGFIISAEDNINVSTPGPIIVLRTD